MDSTACNRIYLLGHFEVVRGDQVLPASCWSRRKAATLVQRLALDRRLLKDQVIEFLWPETDLIAGANNLYRTLYNLRQTLDTQLGEGASGEIVGFDNGVLYLHEAVWVDAEAFMHLSMTDPEHSSQQQVDQCEQALHLYRGELLPDDRYADWTFVPREELRWRQRELRLTLAAHARDAGNHPDAISHLRTLLTQDSADEPVHRALMQVYAAAGQRHEALRQYQVCVDALADELDAPPDHATEALHTHILHQAMPTVTKQTSPIPAIELSVQHPPLVGRQDELDRIRGALHPIWRGKGRVLWLVGETGVGKTRLAGEVLRLAAAEGVTVLFGAAYAPEGQLPYQPFREALDRYLAEQRRMHEPNPVAHPRRPDGGNTREERWTVFRTTAALLEDAAVRAPVLLAIDNLDAADEASLQLFHYLARHTYSRPIALLATDRSDSVTPPTTSLKQLRQSLYRQRLSETIRLKPLDAQATMQLMAYLLGGTAAPTLAQTIFDLTRGLPFFIEALTSTLRVAGHLVRARDGWQFRAGITIGIGLTAELSELVHARIQGLGPTVEAVLAAAAVIGDNVRFADLHQATQLPDSVLLDALDKALMGCLLEETGDIYRFRYPLIRHILCAALSGERLAQLRQRVTEAHI